MLRFALVLTTLLLTSQAIAATPGARACRPEERARLLAPPGPGDEQVVLACSVKLGPQDRVLRRILIEGAEGSGVTLDCAGAAIGNAATPTPFGKFTVEIRSRALGPGADGQGRWSRPSDVTLENCTIHGPIRVWGMGINGQGKAVGESSRALGHTERAQAAAPTRVRVIGSHLIGQGVVPLYLAPGVTESSLAGSEVTGRSKASAVYLDAESARNVIEGNRFDIETKTAVISVDGSAHNRIGDNHFVLHGVGGIELYRNCGEGGTIRHQTPSDNVITGNRFTQKGFMPHATINVGAREGWRLYCGEDDGYPFGSSADNGDHAERNRVENNRDE